MNRRTFLATAIATLAAPSLVVAAQETPPWVRRNFEPVEPDSPIAGIHTMVNLYADPAAARAVIDELTATGHLAPADGTPVSFPPIEVLTTPTEITLPAVMRRYDGPAVNDHAPDATIPYVTIDVQRDSYVVTVMVRGDDEADLISLATDLMTTMLTYDLPDSNPIQDETGRHSGGMWDLMLDEADAPEGFRLYQESDPEGVVNFDG